MITAKELRESVVSESRQQLIEQIIVEAAERGGGYATLDFSAFGYDWKDISWLEQFGYKIFRNGPCLWWEVRWDE